MRVVDEELAGDASALPQRFKILRVGIANQQKLVLMLMGESLCTLKLPARTPSQAKVAVAIGGSLRSAASERPGP